MCGSVFDHQNTHTAHAYARTHTILLTDPNMCVCVEVDTLYCGEVGYLAAQIKSVKDARVGDTITLSKTQAEESLPGYIEVQPMVYCGLFPTDSNQYQV